MNPIYTVYIIQSLKDDSFYIGYSANIEERINKHNNGNSRYTSKKIPWKLAYTEEFSSKSDAIKRERFLKNRKIKISTSG
ncbi:putative endonuclease [Aquimarina sp. EL_43]|uniref:GIY-YIG nuclease family protein n=1 Tax=unclassified Aquimarina TaxID=2627091 RepID=UPI0018CABFCA|nr:MULTISPECIES: GIY-YIG nuclease family protein [unclassified Aquimarina]MBG6130487.1 putative endonuclease [Aquimarina sp. EL_35]MBG6149267.1 putative endonuclease [Aquimarina sp. EL_32]MBG6168359.1 putative endonuclease [Aquimarina sp. EL_43]